MLEYYSHLCACGCGGQIEIKKWHKWDDIPKYIKGHNKSQLGKKRTIEQRQNLSNSLKGRKTWNKGVKGCFSEESRLQISNTVSLLWETEEYNKKQKEARNLFPNKAEL